MQELIEKLQNEFGVSAETAKAGAGSVMTMIQSKLPTGDWQALVEKAPEIRQWSGEAPTVSAAAVVGGMPPDSRRLLLEVLQQHGLSADTAPKFVAATLEAIEPILGAGQVGALRKEMIGKAQPPA